MEVREHSGADNETVKSRAQPFAVQISKWSAEQKICEVPLRIEGKREQKLFKLRWKFFHSKKNFLWTTDEKEKVSSEKFHFLSSLSRE